MTRQDIPRGHCRTPFYLRGRPGVIERCLGHFRNPETLAYGKPGLPKVGLYKVRYELPHLWQSYTGGRADTLVADIFEFWLDPA
jgi:nitrile hydratase